MKTKLISSVVTVLVILFMAACTSPSTPTTSPTTDNPGNSAAYPSTENGSEAAYPSPDENTPNDFVIEVIPAPEADMSVVTGYLKQRQESGVQPVNRALLSLGKVLVNAEGTPTVAQLDLTTALRTSVDKNGRFLFVNVPPGQYVLVYDRLVEAYMLNDPSSGGDFVFTTTANQTLDLGELIYDQLPGEVNEGTP